MTANINAIRRRRNEALKSMSVVLVRKLLLDDLEQLICEVERLQKGANGKSDPSEGLWTHEESYCVPYTRRDGTRVKRWYRRKVRYENGKKIVKHIKGSGSQYETPLKKL